MAKDARHATLVAIVVTLTAGGALVAQGALAQLGLTEGAARRFLFDELKGPTIHGRRSEIAIAGTRAFYKLPTAARGPAAAGLFAWARAYVNSPAFRKAYADLRQDATPQERQDAQTVDAEVKKQINENAARRANERYPSDPQLLFARRLRQFLAETADVNFSARTISLTGGADGIEFVDPVDRKRSWLWQLAAIAGREATAAARAEAESWLKDIER